MIPRDIHCISGWCVFIHVRFVPLEFPCLHYKIIRGLVVHPTPSLNLLTTFLRNYMLYLPGGINEPMYFYETKICCGLVL